MKYIIAILFILTLAIYLFLLNGYYPLFQKHPTATLTPMATPKINQVKTIEYEGRTYAYDFFRVSQISSIELIPNFVTRFASKNLTVQNNCTLAINAGYYDKDYKPLGLFIAGKKTFGSAIPSALLNGFFTIDDTNYATIQSLYTDATHVALQSGPLLIHGGEPLFLKIKNDEFARRSIAAIARNKSVIFFSVFLPDSDISGPLLQNLPGIIMAINKDQKLDLSHALNLDGGSASFFKGEKLYLEEITTVGGVFCVR